MRPAIARAHRRAALLVALLAAGCSSDGAVGPIPDPVPGPGDFTRVLVFDGRTRTYLLHVPPTDASDGSPALVLAFHGVPSGPEEIRAITAFDGLAETTLTVLDEFGAFPAVIDRELRRYLPFLATTKVLMAAVRAGVGREVAHEAIKEHAVAVALEMREKGTEGNDLLDRLAADDRLGLTPAQVAGVVAEPIGFVGRARSQTAAFVAEVEALVAADPEAAAYAPAPIL